MTDQTTPTAITTQPQVPVAGWLALASFFALLLGGAVYLLVDSNDRTRIVMSSGERKARAYIADLTRDPAAVQFRKIIADDGCVQGEVNAKNAYGAYVGYQAFYYNVKEDLGAIDESRSLPTLPGSDEALDSMSQHMDFVLAQSRCGLGKSVKR